MLNRFLSKRNFLIVLVITFLQLCFTACSLDGGVDEIHVPIGRWVKNAYTDQTELGRITTIVFNPNDSNTIYAVSRRGYVIKVQYHGDYITNDYLTMPNEYRVSVPRGMGIGMSMGSPEYLESLCSSNSGILYAAFAGIMQSLNGGKDWKQIYKMPSVFSISVDPNNDSIVIAGTEYEGVIRSADKGQSWEKVYEFHFALVVLFDAQGHILVGGGSGLSESTDSGITWKKLNDKFVTSLAINPNNTSEIYAGSANSTPGEEKLLYSADRGQTWSVIREGFLPKV